MNKLSNKTVESQLNWLIVPKCGCRIGSLFAIDHIGYDGVAIRRGVLGVWTCISTMRQVIVFKCEVFVWFNWNKLCDIFSAGGRFLRQTRLRANIVCLFFTLSIHIVFFRWESACWWARSVTWEIYDLHPSQESIKEKITLTSSKVCLNTTYEGNHTYSSTTILTECVLNKGCNQVWRGADQWSGFPQKCDAEQELASITKSLSTHRSQSLW